MNQTRFVPDDRYATAPPLPTNRPPTREECWNHAKHFFSGLKSETEIATFARDQWAWYYVTWVNNRAWKAQPDWIEGDPIIEVGVPKLFEAGHGRSYYNDVRALLERARERKAA